MEKTTKQLERFGGLPDAETQILNGLFKDQKYYKRDQDLVTEGRSSSFVGVVLDGMLCRYKTLPGGERQILSFLLPGDLFDLQGLLLNKPDHSISAITASQITVTSRTALMEAMQAWPRIERRIWQEIAAEGCVFREWIVNTGRRNAHARMAHLFCELSTRMSRARLVERGGFALPITQHDLGDALGLSIVHVNRVVQELRNLHLITWQNARLTILDWRVLADMAGFSTHYLQVPGSSGRERTLMVEGPSVQPRVV